MEHYWLMIQYRKHLTVIVVMCDAHLNVEADVVSGHGLLQRLVVHLHGLHLRGDGRRGKNHHHACKNSACLNCVSEGVVSIVTPIMVT